MSDYDHDAVIIGSGPSGIAAATALSQAGIKDIVVLEREDHIGGIPRHTHHPSFGLLVFKRPLTGPKYIRALLDKCPNVHFKTNTTVTALKAGGKLEVATPSGLRIICARHIILATGARETPRHGRLVSGLRPQGVMTTGALQQFIYSLGLRPFERPVIIGTELVSFSALWTLRHAGIKPAAMIEENSRITAYRPMALFARLLGIPIHYNSKISDIEDIEILKQVTIEKLDGNNMKIPCDGVIFSGNFIGENSLAAASHLTINLSNRITQVDQNWVTSDPTISATGNAIHPADMGDQCYLEGLKVGLHVAEVLTGKHKVADNILPIRHGAIIKMTAPSVLRPDKSKEIIFDLSFHVTTSFNGTVQLCQGTEILHQETKCCLPARRITLKNIHLQSNIFEKDQPIDIILLGADKRSFSY